MRVKAINIFQSLCFVILFLLLVPVSVCAEEKITLRAAFYPLKGFFEYDNHGEEIGYGVDLLNKISEYSNLEFVYVPAESWEMTKEMILNKEADLRMPATEPMVPSEELGYTRHSIIDTFYALMTKKSREDLNYNAMEAFVGLSIGVSRNLYESTRVQNYLEREDVATENFVFYESYDACYQALLDGEVDAVISNVMDLNEGMKILTRFEAESNYICMSIDNPNLAGMNDAINIIHMEEPDFFVELAKKWFPERSITPLTVQERNQLLKMQGKICFYHTPGQGYLCLEDEEGNRQGFLPDLEKLICDKMEFVWQEYDVQTADESSIVIIPDFYYDNDWAVGHDVKTTRPYFQLNYYEITRKGDRSQETGMVAAIPGFMISQDFVEAYYTEEQIVWCEDYEECLDMVRNGKADITYVNVQSAEYYLNAFRYSNLAAELTDYSNRICFAVWGDESEFIVSALNKVLQTITQEQIDELLAASRTIKIDQTSLRDMVYVNPGFYVVIFSGCTAVVAALIVILIFWKREQDKNRMLKQAMNAKQDFLARMSHDMRTPMNAIIGFSKFGRETENLQEARDYHVKIGESGEYLLSLINDTLSLSKIENGKLTLQKETYAFEEFLKQIEQTIRPMAEKKGVQFQIENRDGFADYLLTDKIRLQQIFLNLLNNAVKFTEEGGFVRFCIETEGQEERKIWLKFTVQDNGVGMTEKFQKDKLYKSFEQEGRGDTEMGTGLGLSIVKNLVSAFEGYISCESQVDRGTTFTLYIPFVTQIADSVPKNTKTEHTSLSGKRILLCEDHPVNREIAGRLLKKAGMEVTFAENGKKGLEQFLNSEEEYFQAILMDIRMPVMDGLTAAKEIRKAQRRDAKTIVILAVSANAFDEDAKKSLAAGMNGHLTKPIEPEKLYQELEDRI